ncbi:MAG: SPOR domain-containing protein [Robiginitomaculum sp.]|nr:SPOR domain-containing protein [Robiginitomaculum sp.]
MRRFLCMIALSALPFAVGCAKFDEPNAARATYMGRLSPEAQELRIAVDVVTARLRQVETQDDWDLLEPVSQEIYYLAAALLPGGQRIAAGTGIAPRAMANKPSVTRTMPIAVARQSPMVKSERDATIIPASLSSTAQDEFAPPPMLKNSRSLFFAVQLGSYRTMDRAVVGWQELRSIAPDVLGELRPRFEQVDLGERGMFVRLKAGPFYSEAKVNAICETLSVQNIACLRADFTGADRG